MSTEKSSRQARPPRKTVREFIIIILGGIIINAFCFLLCSITGHCASSNSFPYNLNTTYGYGNYPNINELRDNYVGGYKDVIIADLQSTYNVSSDAPLLITFYDASDSTGSGYAILKFNIYTYPGTPDNVSSSASYETTTVRVNYTHCYRLWYKYYYQTNVFTYYYYQDVDSYSYVSLFGTPNLFDFSNYYDFPNIVQVMNYPMFVNNLDIMYSANDTPIISSVIVPNTTTFNDAPFITGHALPTQPTAPTFTPPTYDSSLSLVENVKVFIQWLGQYIGNLFVWLLQSLFDFLDKLLQNLKAFINAVIQAINNGFSNIYNNIVSLFSPFFNTVLGNLQNIIDSLPSNIQNDLTVIKENLVAFRTAFLSFVDFCQTIMTQYGVIWNKQTFKDAWDNSTFIQGNLGFVSAFTDFRTTMLSVNELEHIKFDLDFSNSYYNFGHCELSFDWLIPYKTSIRGVIWVIVWLNFVNFFFDEAPNFLSGGVSNNKADK